MLIVVVERSATLGSLVSLCATCLGQEWDGSASGEGEGWAVGNRVRQRLVLWVWALQFLVCMGHCLVSLSQAHIQRVAWKMSRCL